MPVAKQQIGYTQILRHEVKPFPRHAISCHVLFSY